MKPEIYAAREGYNIVLARALIGDPKLEYRRIVERLAKQREISFVPRNILDNLRERLKQSPKTDVRISVVGRGTLNAWRDKLGLSSDVVADIETEVLRPYREFEKNRQRYKQVLKQATRQAKVLSQSTRESLRHFQSVLGLRDEDVADIEAQVAQRTRQARSSIKPISTSGSNLLTLTGGAALAVLIGVLVFIFTRQIFPGDRTSPDVTLSPSERPSVQSGTPDQGSPSSSTPFLSPSNTPDSQTQETELLQQADEKNARGDYQSAISDYGQVIQLNSDNVRAYSGRGNAYYFLKEYQKAINDYTQAIRLKPKDDVLLINRGFAYGAAGDQQATSGSEQLSKESRSNAIKDYNEAIRVKPSARAYMERGNVRCSFKDAAGAAKDYEKAADLSLDGKGDIRNYQPALIAKEKIQRGDTCN